MQTTDGWTISTVEQDGDYAGEEIGRVWFKDPTPHTNCWHHFTVDSVPDARRLADKARSMTYAAWEAYYETQP